MSTTTSTIAIRKVTSGFNGSISWQLYDGSVPNGSVYGLYGTLRQAAAALDRIEEILGQIEVLKDKLEEMAEDQYEPEGD